MRNEQGVTNEYNSDDLASIVNGLFLYHNCSKLYDIQNLRQFLLDRSLFLENKIIHKYKNREISEFYVVLRYYVKHRQFKVLTLFLQILYAKAKARFGKV